MADNVDLEEHDSEGAPLEVPDYSGPDLRALLDVESYPASQYPDTEARGSLASSHSTELASLEDFAEFYRISCLYSRVPIPSIWSFLPNDILCIIVENCDRQTLISWSCTNSLFYNLASNILWRSLQILPQDLDGAHRTCRNSFGMDPRIFEKNKEGMLIPFLTNTPFRSHPLKNVVFPLIAGQKPKLPAQRIKFLSVDFRGERRGQETIFQNRKLIVLAFANSIEQMTQLQRCHFEGRVFPQMMKPLLEKKHTLRELALRWGSEYLRATEQGLGPSLVAFNQILDLRVLAGLRQLRTLTIGRLVPQEARGLAEAVVKLRLEVLVVVSAPPADNNDTNRSLVGTKDDESPLLIFLDCVCQLKPMIKTHAGFWEGGLPPTLRHLRLKDLYRSAKSNKKMTILNAIGNCTELRGLELRTMASTQLKIFFQRAQMPALKHLDVSGCRHFLADNEWTALGLPPDCFADGQVSSCGKIGVFRRFLFRHRHHLIDLRISMPAMPVNISDHHSLFFRKWHLDRLRAMSGPIHERMEPNVQNWLNFQRGEWGQSCSIEGFCYVQNIPRPVTMRRLGDMIS
ncbi:MAG: hypothetical protein Q9188_004866 [Gyalolechia gomerana]